MTMEKKSTHTSRGSGREKAEKDPAYDNQYQRRQGPYLLKRLLEIMKAERIFRRWRQARVQQRTGDDHGRVQHRRHYPGDYPGDE